MPRIQLKELVQEVRRQLESLDQERTAAGADALFELQSMELELRFTVEESTTGKGGFDLKVITAGGEDKESSESVQTVKITYRVPDGYRGFGGRAHSSGHRQANKDEGIRPLE